MRGIYRDCGKDTRRAGDADKEAGRRGDKETGQSRLGAGLGRARPAPPKEGPRPAACGGGGPGSILSLVPERYKTHETYQGGPGRAAGGGRGRVRGPVGHDEFAVG